MGKKCFPDDNILGLGASYKKQSDKKKCIPDHTYPMWGENWREANGEKIFLFKETAHAVQRLECWKRRMEWFSWVNVLYV